MKYDLEPGRSQKAIWVWGLFAWKSREQLRLVRENMGCERETLEKVERKKPVKKAEKVWLGRQEGN